MRRKDRSNFGDSIQGKLPGCATSYKNKRLRPPNWWPGRTMTPPSSLAPPTISVLYGKARDHPVPDMLQCRLSLSTGPE